MIHPVRLLFYVSLDTLRSVPSNYYFDLGIEVLNTTHKYHKDELELRPLNTQGMSYTLTVGDLLRDYVNVSDAEIISISGLWKKPFSFDYGARVFPIVRDANWENGMCVCFCVICA